LAARVGGIQDNVNKPVEYINDNLLINTNILKAAYEFKVNKFIGILSSCIYPSVVDSYPMVEEQLHDGPPWVNNIGYGYAKRCLALQIDSYNKQYGTKWNYIIPGNLYSEYDNFTDSQKMHFVTSLLFKIKNAENNQIELLGDGTALRQFMHADDFAKVISQVVENEIYDNFNVATPENLSIKEMAEIALDACDSNHLNIIWDTTKPNGQLRKDVSIDVLKSNISNFTPTPLYEGVKKIYTNLKNKGK
jgi:GDP-L-fucose synthase